MLNSVVLAKEIVPYSPAEKWLLSYENGKQESVSITDGGVFHVPGGPRLNGVVTFSQEIIAQEDQMLQIGIGADWFWRCRLNGQVVADHMVEGNQCAPIQKGNHVVLLPVKRGRNQLEVEVKSGSQGWSLAIGEIPLVYDERQEQLNTVLLPSNRPQDNYIQSFLPRNFFVRLENGAFDGMIYPPVSDREAWDAVKTHPAKQRLIREIVERADAILNEEIPLLVFSEYRRFMIDGNRSGYESKYFARRRNMGTLVLALALTNDKERYLAKTIDYLNAILEEWTWCLPAHMSWNSRSRSPEKFYQSCIFASETGAQLALTVNVIGSLLEEDWPGLTERIREITLARTVRNPLSIETCRRNFWIHDEIPGNWTPWCGTNLIITALILEPDLQKRSEAVQAFLKGVSRFAWYYPEDGYCMEGPTYYSVAAGKLYHLCRIFERVMPGSMETFYQNPKNRAIFEFIAHATVHSWLVSFGDAGLTSGAYRGAAALQSCAYSLKSEKLQRCAAGELSFNGGELGSGLMALFDIPEEASALPPGDEDECSFFQNRLIVFRSDLLSASLKAGNNGEYHNHNDLGHFSIWSGEQPLVIDFGAGVYTKEYFSDKRYTIWNTRGQGHNAPVFDGIEQLNGKQYTASLRLAPERGNTAICDLSQSYPEEAGVSGFTREMRFSPDRVSIEDRLQLKQARKVRIYLLCAIPPDINGHKIQFGEVTLELKNLNYVSQRKIDVQNGRSITELVLETTSDHYRMDFLSESGN